jgi:pimeloyl-ACP methyl ester carboxylesterase
MALPDLVLVHGGGLAADSWELTVEEIHRLAPELTVLALDMPGRRNKPGDLREMTIADYVESLVGDIESPAKLKASTRVLAPVEGFSFRSCSGIGLALTR